MSKLYEPAFADPHYGLERPLGRGYTRAAGPGTPSALSLPTAGYAKFCIYQDLTNGGIYVNTGSITAATWLRIDSAVDLSGLTATAAELNVLHSQTIAGTPLAGFTGGTGTVFKQSRMKLGDLYETRLFFDLTGLGSSTTDLDIIGQGAAAAAYLCKLTAAECGTTIQALSMQCLEAPATGVTDIDLYSATEGTGKFDDAVTGLTETALITAGGAWTNGATKGCTTVPLSTEYIYVCNGAAGTVGTYTAGKFLVTIYGSD